MELLCAIMWDTMVCIGRELKKKTCFHDNTLQLDI